MDEKQIFQCRASSTLSNVVGNATLIVKEFMEGLFPPGYFKSVYIDTTMSSLQMQKNPDEVYKRDKPFLVLRPRVTIDDSHIFGRLPDWTYTTYFNYTNGKDTYVPVFADEQDKIYVYAAPDRIKINYDIEIHCNTKMQQINVAHFLKGSARHKGYFYIYNSVMETEVPKLFIKLISELKGFDLGCPCEHADFINYLESNSQSFVTEKIKASNASPCYFYKYKVNMLSLFEEYPEMDDGEEKEHINTNFRVIERFSVDFTIPANFFLETKRVVNPEYMENNKWEAIDLDDKVLLNYTMKMLPEKSININGKIFSLLSKQAYITDSAEDIKITDDKNQRYAEKLYTNGVIHADKNDICYIRSNTMDVLDLTGFFNQDNLKVIEYCKKYHQDLNNVFYFKLFENNHIVKQSNIFIDWETYELFNFNVIADGTYHILFYKSNEEYNRILDRIRQKEERSIAKKKTIITPENNDIFRY